MISGDEPHYCPLGGSASPSTPKSEPVVFVVVSQVTVESLPVLARDGIRLREVHLSDAAALTALFQIPEVSAYLDPPPGSIDEFGRWITLCTTRRAEGRAAVYSLLTGNDEVTGLFMALRFDDPHRAEIGFAMAPHLWGTGIFCRTIAIYLDFLFNEWGVNTLVGKTLANNERGVGAMKKLGATVIDTNDKNGVDEFVWTIEKP